MPTPMTLIGDRGQRLLCGRLTENLERGTVVVLTKPTPTTFKLMAVDTTKPDQLASFLSADEAEANSLAHAVAVAIKPKRRSRRKAK
ncbi:hypothetical protein V7x_54830 [Crateriforma conspicua]|uniref:Uncharacterized protein n=1 Tax=Crateriforma conspicua TaxID=2527996 RepID=A0A5C6FHP9_9PLAN|nr:hypothetical protein [Crateriforma conspicua]TWU59709.1 hypothetical protein V7x_54830 [Crateriforma conspicua]